MPTAGFGGAATDPLSAMKRSSGGAGTRQVAMDPLSGGRMLDPLSGNPLGSAATKKTSSAAYDPLSGAKASNGGASFDPMNPLAGPSKSAAPVAKPAAPQFEALLPLPDDYQNRFIEKLCKQTALQPETLDKVTQVAQKKNLIALRNKAIKLIDQLNEPHINLASLQLLTFTGVPNVPSQDILQPSANVRAKRSDTDIVALRPMVWRVICGALPLDTARWEATMQEHYKTYEDFKKELIVQPKLKAEEEKKE